MLSAALRQKTQLLQPVLSAAKRWLGSLPEFDYQPPSYDGPSRTEVMSLRKEYLNPGIFHHFKSPVMIVNGKMQYVFDETGRRYLDAFAGIVTVSVGHCHPDVTKSIHDQVDRLQHMTTVYLNNQIAEYGAEMAAKMPGDLKVSNQSKLVIHVIARTEQLVASTSQVCYFVNSGSEANDLALLMARLYTGHQDVVCLRNAYHGVSLGTMPTCGHSTWRHDLGTTNILHAMNPDPYRGVFGSDSEAYVADLKDLIISGSSGRLAGFLAETIQGVGGAMPIADGYLAKAYEAVREAGGICIADEVQTGFGRTGSHYWGFQRQGVIPDIVTMAKGIGNGIPLAAVVTTPAIASVLTQRLHLNTFGGNPVSCAAGRAVLKVIEKDKLQENTAHVGNYLLGAFEKLARTHDIIGNVRGAGLMLGVELVKDRKSKTPASAELGYAMEMLKDKYSILIGKGGLHGNVFRIKPPMCFSQADADYLIASMDETLASL